jgi:membrane fusion protein (multidrug efflux system)
VQDGQWLVTEGLKAGDRVVVEGFQKFVAGDKVRPQSWFEAADASNNTITSQSATVQR